MNIPANLMYTKEHEWIRVEENVAYIGITDYAQKELGEIVYIEIETVGETLTAGEVFGTVEAVKTISELFMPVSGKVLEVNEALENAPELINNDPYKAGWMIKLAVSDTAELNNLLTAEAYTALIG